MAAALGVDASRVQVYSHDRPIRHRMHEYIFHDRPIRRRSRGYILTMDQSRAGGRRRLRRPGRRVRGDQAAEGPLAGGGEHALLGAPANARGEGDGGGARDDSGRHLRAAHRGRGERQQR
eukprot:7771776-Pyramimonas_sp.AAC.1